VQLPGRAQPAKLKYENLQVLQMAKGQRKAEVDPNHGHSSENAHLNPWMAGQHLSLCVYGFGIVNGLNIVDCVAQCRSAVHIYNALRCIGALEKPIPTFELLMQHLSEGEGLWVGGRPTSKGSFLKAYMLAYGFAIRDVDRFARLARGDIATLLKETGRNQKDEKMHGRDLKHHDPKSVSISYRRVVARDYAISSIKNAEASKIGDQKRTSNTVPNMEVSAYDANKGGLSAILHETRNAMENDGLIGVNLACIGNELIYFQEKLMDELGIREKVEKDLAKKLSMRSKKGQRRDKSGKIKGRESEENYRRTAYNYGFFGLFATCDQDRYDKHVPEGFYPMSVFRAAEFFRKAADTTLKLSRFKFVLF